MRTVALLWGVLPGAFKRAGTAPRPSETVASRVLEANVRVHVVGNVRIRFLPSRATAEMDAHEVPPDVRGSVIKWVELEGEPRLLPQGAYAVLVRGFEDLKDLAVLMKVNPFSRFVVEVDPETPPDVSFAVFEVLRFNPQVVFRDAAFHALRGQYKPPNDVVVVGSRVYEADWRAVALRLRAPRVYGAPELGYIASGYFPPENDPYLWWARKFTSFTLVELPPPPPRESLPWRPPEEPQRARSEPRAELAEDRSRGGERGGDAHDQEREEEEGVEELEAEGEL